MTQAKPKLPQKPSTGKDNSLMKKDPPAGKKLSPKKKTTGTQAIKRIKPKPKTMEVSNFSQTPFKLVTEGMEGKRRETPKVFASKDVQAIISAIQSLTLVVSKGLG